MCLPNISSHSENHITKKKYTMKKESINIPANRKMKNYFFLSWDTDASKSKPVSGLRPPPLIFFRLSIQCHKKTNQNCHQKLVLKNHIFYWDISIIYVIFHLMTKLNDIACCCATYSNYMEYNNNENTNLKEARSIERYLISFIMSIVSEINQTKF